MSSKVTDNTVVTFQRNQDNGRLFWSEQQKDLVNGINLLADPQNITVSPDGRFLYSAADTDHTINNVFEIDRL